MVIGHGTLAKRVPISTGIKTSLKFPSPQCLPLLAGTLRFPLEAILLLVAVFISYHFFSLLSWVCNSGLPLFNCSL